MRAETPTIKASSAGRQTVYVVQPFEMRKQGRRTGLAPASPIPARDSSHAKLLLERTAHRTGIVGAVAFSRTGDPATGDYDDAIIIGQVGQVLEEPA